MRQFKREVLLIEDNMADVELIRKMLSNGGGEYTVKTADRLSSGLKILEQETADVVLLDLGLPDSSGIDTFRKVQERKPNVAVVVLTGYADEELAIKGISLGAQDYLMKGKIESDLLYRSIAYSIERKRAEVALRESEQRFAAFMLHLPAAAWIKDLQGRYIYANSEAERIFSTPIDELLGKTDFDIFPENTARQFVANDQRVLAEGGSFETTEVLLQADGIEHCSIVNKFAVPGPDGHPAYIAGVAFDITERMQAEEALKKSEERYRALVHTTSSTVWRVSGDGRQLLELAGTVPGEYKDVDIRNVDWLNVIHPDDRQRTLEAWRGAVESKSLYENEQRSLHPDGTYHYFLSRGVPLLNSAGEVGEWIGSSIDVTERKRAEQALLDSEERFRTLADNISQLAWMADDKGNIFWFNTRWYDYTGTTPDEMQGGGWQKLLHYEHARRVLDSVLRSFETGEPWEETFPVRGKDGSYRWFLARAIPIRNERGMVVRWFGTKTDITERMRMEEEIRQMAQHDMLTGLPNRRLFNEIIAVELAQARRNNKKLALFFLDLDRFKEINDTLGHEAGDELLKQAAARLKGAVRVSDTVARTGGDEFNVVIPDIYYPEYASEVAQKILDEIRRPFTARGHELTVSTSIGISIFPHDSEEIDTLLRYADIAMYHAKERGRNMYQFYNPVINTRSRERVQFEDSLRHAIDQDEFRLFYQPLVDVKTGKIVSAEALLRWQHPGKDFLVPEQFLNDAEDIGFMPQIDEWVLKHAGKQIRSWMDKGISPLCITINLSSREFQNSDLSRRISKILEETGLPPECLDIEIEESAAMGNIENTIARLRELTRMGAHVSIDHFGTGSSSLNQLRRLPIQKLKIDRTFVSDISGNSNDGMIIKAILFLAHSMNLKVVAEGVETEEQLSFLKKVGCDEAQGFLFSRPLPAEEFEEVITAKR